MYQSFMLWVNRDSLKGRMYAFSYQGDLVSL